MSPRLRLGGALLIPEPVRREVDGLRAAVGDGSLGRVPAHLTLVPPVNVNERHLDDVLSVLRDAAAATEPFTTSLGPPATFLPDNPVLYLQVGDGVDDVLALRERIFRPPLERKLSWPYVAHVTLCDEGDPERIEAAVTSLADYRATVTFTRLHLLRQHEGVWEPWADAALGGRRVVGRGGLELEITEAERLDPDLRSWLDDQWAGHNRSADRTWNEQPFALTARREGEVVGAATGWTNEGVAHLSELMVDPVARSQGVGGRLIEAFEDVARRRGCRRLSLRTEQGNPAQAVYERKGWRVEAVFDDWVGGHPTAQMRKEL